MLPQYAEQYLIRGVGLVKDLDDLRAIVLKEKDGVPVYVRDVAEVQIGHEVRQGAVIKNGTTEAVGGVVMMIAGGNAKDGGQPRSRRGSTRSTPRACCPTA